MKVTQDDLIALIRQSIGGDKKQREYEVRLDIAIQLEEKPPYDVWFEPNDGWHCTCPMCRPIVNKRELAMNKTKVVDSAGGFTGGLNIK